MLPGTSKNLGCEGPDPLAGRPITLFLDTVPHPLTHYPGRHPGVPLEPDGITVLVFAQGHTLWGSGLSPGWAPLIGAACRTQVSCLARLLPCCPADPSCWPLIPAPDMHLCELLEKEKAAFCRGSGSSGLGSPAPVCQESLVEAGSAFIHLPGRPALPRAL